MIVLIMGRSGSGKSEYAEAYTGEIAGNSRKYYLATMQVQDNEGQERVKRHRRQRSGKGFITIEQPRAIHKALEKMKKLDTGLLECILNLTANEMFCNEMPKSCEEVVDKIIKEIELLSRGLRHLVIVSNNVFEDEAGYDEETIEYIRAVERVNEKLSAIADKVVEVVEGIPIVVKEREMLEK